MKCEVPLGKPSNGPALFPGKGDRVSHGTYGAGTITELDVHHTVIDFDAHGVRRFLSDRVVLEHTSDPGPSPSERRLTALRRQRDERARKRAAALDV
jgi:hypothetical protein